MASWIPAPLSAGQEPPLPLSAASAPRLVDSHGYWLLPATPPPCPRPFPGLELATQPPRFLPPLAVVSMAREYSPLARSRHDAALGSIPERWAAYAAAGVPSAALMEIHSPTAALHPLSAFEAMPWMLSPGVSAAWWAALCRNGVVTLQADDVSVRIDALQEDQGSESGKVQEGLSDSPAAAVDAEGGAEAGPGVQPECGRLAELALAQGSGAALPLAFVQGYAAKSSRGMRAALAAMLADAVVLVPNASATDASATPGFSTLPTAAPVKPAGDPHARLVLAAESRAYISVGWRVALAPAWPAQNLVPESLATLDWLRFSPGTFGEQADGTVASDVVRVATRNLGVLVGEAEGVHEDTGRWAENCVAWMTGHLQSGATRRT